MNEVEIAVDRKKVAGLFDINSMPKTQNYNAQGALGLPIYPWKWTHVLQSLRDEPAIIKLEAMDLSWWAAIISMKRQGLCLAPGLPFRVMGSDSIVSQTGHCVTDKSFLVAEKQVADIVLSPALMDVNLESMFSTKRIVRPGSSSPALTNQASH